MTYFTDISNQSRFASQIISPHGASTLAAWNPVHMGRSQAYRLSEDEQAFVLAIDLPGVEAQSLDIQVDNGVLRVQAQRSTLQPDGFKPIYGEFKQRRFDYQFSLGDKVVVDEIQATFEQGVLRLRLAKRPEATARKIAVTAA